MNRSTPVAYLGFRKGGSHGERMEREPITGNLGSVRVHLRHQTQRCVYFERFHFVICDIGLIIFPSSAIAECVTIATFVAHHHHQLSSSDAEG